MVLSYFFMNLYIDPLNYIRANTASHFSSERSLKSRMIEENNNYDGIIFGTSKTAFIAPEDIITDDKILNASFAGAKPEEILMFLQEKKPKVRWVAIGFDWLMFNERDWPYVEMDKTDKLFSYENSEVFSYLMSSSTTLYSIKTIIKSIRHNDPKYTEHGARSTKEKKAKHSTVAVERGRHYYSLVLSKEKVFFTDYRVSKRRLEVVSKIQKWATKNNIKLVGWMNPQKQDILNLLEFQHNQEILSLPDQLSQRIYNFKDVSKSYPQKKHYFRWDPDHYTRNLASQFFNKDIIPLIHSSKKSTSPLQSNK